MKRYLIQTKPRILLLLTFTGVIGYIIPSIEDINWINLILFTFFGVSAAAGGLTINNVIDRDIDEVMIRTSSRPTVGDNAIPTMNLFIFGFTLSVIGFVGGFLVFGFYTFFHLAFGNIFYIIGYSMYLKRKSILNTILGGLASPAPVWAAFAARYELGSIPTGWHFLGVNLEGWLLGGLVFIWTPSHTWAMATKNYEDYVNTNIPMLPVVIGIRKTSVYTLIFGVVTLIYGTWLSYWISERILVILAMSIPNLFLLHSLWVFYRDPKVETGKYSFFAHNIWLTVVFSTILLFMWTK